MDSKNTAISKHTVIPNLSQGVSSSICWCFMTASGHAAHPDPRLQWGPAQQYEAKPVLTELPQINLAFDFG